MGIYTDVTSYYGVIISQEENEEVADFDEDGEPGIFKFAEELAKKYKLVADMFGNLAAGDGCGHIIGTSDFTANPSSVVATDLEYVDEYNVYNVDDNAKEKIEAANAELKARGYTTYVGAWQVTYTG